MFNPKTTVDILDAQDYPGYRNSESVVVGPTDGAKNPGFRYSPNHDSCSHSKRPVAHSFGSAPRRKDPLKNCLPTSTPVNVGPNSYHPNPVALHSLKAPPNQRFGKQKRVLHSIDLTRLNDSLLDYSAIGRQTDSLKKTGPAVSMGRARKDSRFVGVVDQRSLKLALPHAVY